MHNSKALEALLHMHPIDCNNKISCEYRSAAHRLIHPKTTFVFFFNKESAFGDFAVLPSLMGNPYFWETDDWVALQPAAFRAVVF